MSQYNVQYNSTILVAIDRLFYSIFVLVYHDGVTFKGDVAAESFWYIYLLGRAIAGHLYPL